MLPFFTALCVAIAVYRHRPANPIERVVGVLLAATIAVAAFAASQSDSGHPSHPNDALATLALASVGLAILCTVLGRSWHH